MKKRFLIAALFTLFLGGITTAQSQEQPSTLAELQAEKERRGAKRQEKQIKQKLKKLNKRIEEIKKEEIAN